MSVVQSAPIRRPGVDLVVENHERRLTDLELGMGRWIYVTPVAPATEPPDYSAVVPTVAFQNGWGNVAGQDPVSFRMWPATKVQIRGAVTGGTAPSIVFTLPVFDPVASPWATNYRPPNNVPILFPSTDGLSAWSGLIDTDGNVWVTAQLTGGPGGTGIMFDTEPQPGSWLDIETTGKDGSGAGTHITDSGGGGVFLESDWTDETDASAMLSVQATGLNPAQDGVSAGSFFAENDSAYGVASANGLTAGAVAAFTGTAIGVDSFVFADLEEGVGIAFEGVTGDGGVPRAATVIGLQTDACINFAYPQPIASIPGSEFGCVLYFRADSGPVFKLVALVNGTETVLATG